jgi:hypothetical protein
VWHVFIIEVSNPVVHQSTFIANDVAPTSGMVSPFRQKFLEIDRRQGGDVAPQALYVRAQSVHCHVMRSTLGRDRSPATIFLTTRRDMCDSAMPLLSSDRPDLSFCQIRQKHETEVSHAIHKVSRISSDLRGSDRCRFDVLASSCAGT